MVDHIPQLGRRCPKCGHAPTLWQDCSKPGCLNGHHYFDRRAPLYYPHGYTKVCHGCWGKGFCAWCPECRCDISRQDYLERRKQKAFKQ
jgi:hypothetical protein